MDLSFHWLFGGCRNTPFINISAAEWFHSRICVGADMSVSKFRMCWDSPGQGRMRRAEARQFEG